ncbi:MAG: hypothetical protein RR646_00240 [Erysipelotrichaceae bacterium]
MKKLLLILITLFSFFYSALTLSYTISAIDIWFTKLVPSLLVGLILIKSLYYSGSLNSIYKFLNPILFYLFKLTPNESSLVISSLLLGCPAGSTLFDNAYNNNNITLERSKFLVYSCFCVSPSFILISMSNLYNRTIAISLFIVQLLSVFIILFVKGRAYRLDSRSNDIPIKYYSIFKAINMSIKETIITLLMILGYLVLAISICGIINTITSTNILSYLIEFSTSIYLVENSTLTILFKILLSNIILSFGGICLHIQILSMCDHLPLSYLVFLKYRIFQIIISTVLCYISFFFLK